MVAWLILIDVQTQVLVLNEVRTGLSRLQVVHKRVLCHSKLYSVADCLVLGLESDQVIHHTILKMVHVSLLVPIELTNEALEGLSSLSLSGLRTTTKVLSNTVLQDLIDEVRVTKRLLLFGVLPDYTHELTETILVIDSHFCTL